MGKSKTVFLIAIIFFMFFNISKHGTMSKFNVFAEDPFDAVGSFGVQLALFASLVSLIKAFRPYDKSKEYENQKVLILRANAVSMLAVLVTLIADLIGMLRFKSLLIGSGNGMILAEMVGGMLVLTMIALCKVFCMMKKEGAKSAQNSWHKTTLVWLVSIVVLALYPESWRSCLLGVIFIRLEASGYYLDIFY